MTTVTRAQRELLERAAAMPEGVIDAPEDSKTMKALVRRGSAISLPVAGGGSRLIITDSGRAALTELSGQAATVKDTDASRAEAPGPLPKTENAMDAPAGEHVLKVAPLADPAASTPRSSDRPRGKLGNLLSLLKRPEGATLVAMSEATGWQQHSVRGAMSGALKKKLGLTITSEKTDVGRVYRAVEGEGA
jgi:hypothetical protein